MVLLNSGYRKMYDDLSEVVHPNGSGVIFFFSDLENNVAVFHDGERQTEAALGHFIAATYMLVCAEPTIHKLETRLGRLLHLAQE